MGHNREKEAQSYFYLQVVEINIQSIIKLAGLEWGLSMVRGGYEFKLKVMALSFISSKSSNNI